MVHFYLELGIHTVCVHMLVLCGMWMLTLCFSKTGGSKDQGIDDGVWHYDGGLPATRKQGQLLPHGHLKPGCYDVRHRFPDRRD